MTRKQKRMLARILVSLVLFAVGILFEGWIRFALMGLVWGIAGYRVVLSAFSGLLRGQLLDENFLMTVASVGALALGESSEGAAVMLFFQIGELFQDCAVARSRASISALTALRPDTATVLENGEEQEKDPDEVAVGDLLLVRPGERIPVDGTVEDGSAFLDTAAITGEAEPREAMTGDPVLSGTVNISGVLKIRAQSTYAHSTAARILELVESASDRKAPAEQLITRFAQVYTPAVVAAAVLLAGIPPLVFGQPFSVWITRGLTFLVISCPCALVISVPLSFFGGIGAASKRGILVKGGAVLEQLAAVKRIVFDKTGTLTTGSFRVSGVFGREDTLRLAAAAEQDSAHPAANAIRSAAGTTDKADSVSEVPGFGVTAQIHGKTVCVGNRRLMERQGIDAEAPNPGTTCVYISEEGTYVGRIELADTVREDAAEALRALKTLGVTQTVMLTGDVESAARTTADRCGIDQVHAGLLPQDKVSELERLRSEGGMTAFVGDGVNDAPVLAAADIGIAMGGIGSDAAVEASDLVILQDRLSALPEAVRIGRRTCRIARENIVFALSVKLLVLLLGAFGAAGMWLAVFADIGVAILAILNAMRTMAFLNYA